MTSLSLDTHAKRTLYAAAAIPEYWVVDVQRRRLRVFTEPDPATGTYLATRERELSEALSAQSFPEVVVKISDLFS